MCFLKVYAVFVHIDYVFHFELEYCEISTFIRFKWKTVLGLALNKIHVAKCLRCIF